MRCPLIRCFSAVATFGCRTWAGLEGSEDPVMVDGVEQAGVPALKVVRPLSVSEEHPIAQADRLASRFLLPPPVEAYDFPEKGNINQHTYLVVAGRGQNQGEFLLQRINQQVFTRP